MAIRWRKYHALCKGKRSEGDMHGKVISKGVDCNGKRGKWCPPLPRELSGQACGGWVVSYREINGKWVERIFPGINKTQANEIYQEIMGNLRRNMFGLPNTKRIPTLAEYAKTYLEHFKMAKENTLAMKRRAIVVLVRYLGEYSLDKITPFIIEKFRIQRKEQDAVKDSVLNVDVAILTHVFNTAIREGILEKGKNPCESVKRLKVSQDKDRILSSDEIARILDMPEGKDRLMVLAALFTGMRLNEVLNLSWDDINFNKGLIHAHQSKTGKSIEIPLSDTLRNALEGHRTHSDGDRVFEARPITHKLVAGYSTHFSELFKEMGIGGFTFHNLRHSFASLMQAECGVGAVVVQGMTGHSSLGMLQKYSHTGLDNKRVAIQALNDHVMNTSQARILSIAQ